MGLTVRLGSERETGRERERERVGGRERQDTVKTANPSSLWPWDHMYRLLIAGQMTSLDSFMKRESTTQ